MRQKTTDLRFFGSQNNSSMYQRDERPLSDEKSFSFGKPFFITAEVSTREKLIGIKCIIARAAAVNVIGGHSRLASIGCSFLLIIAHPKTIGLNRYIVFCSICVKNISGTFKFSRGPYTACRDSPLKPGNTAEADLPPVNFSVVQGLCSRSIAAACFNSAGFNAEFRYARGAACGNDQAPSKQDAKSAFEYDCNSCLVSRCGTRTSRQFFSLRCIINGAGYRGRS